MRRDVSEYSKGYGEGWITEQGVYDGMCSMQVLASILSVVDRVICDHVLVYLHPGMLDGLVTWAFSGHGVFDQRRTAHDGHNSTGCTTTIC
jgi:hypothetical protein